jgi:hypothetical protein
MVGKNGGCGRDGWERMEATVEMDRIKVLLRTRACVERKYEKAR